MKGCDFKVKIINQAKEISHRLVCAFDQVYSQRVFNRMSYSKIAFQVIIKIRKPNYCKAQLIGVWVLINKLIT